MAQTKIKGLFLDPTVLSDLTAITDGVPASDYLFVWDAGTSTLKKILPNHLGLAAAAHTIESHTSVTADAGEVNLLDTAVVGNVVNSKAAIYPGTGPSAADQILKSVGSGPYTIAWGTAGGGTTVNGTTDNAILTYINSSSEFTAEANLLYDATTLTLQKDSGRPVLDIAGYANGPNSSGLIRLRHSNNTTPGQNSAMDVGEQIGEIRFDGSDDSAFGTGATIYALSNQVWTGVAHGTRLEFRTTANGATSNATRMVVEHSGDIAIRTGNVVITTAGKGIDFSAQTATSTGTVTSGGEVLDHYEEGTWTPHVTDNTFNHSDGQGYASRNGYYVRIGKVVFFSGRILSNSIGDLTTGNRANIAGLPFTSSSDTNSDCSVSITLSRGGMDLSTGEVPSAYVINSQPAMGLQKFTSVEHVALTVADWTANGGCHFAGHYWVP